MRDSRLHGKKEGAGVLLLIIFMLFVKTWAQEKPHVVFLAGEEEYGSHWTLPKIADDLERRFNVRATVLHSWRSGVGDYDMPGEVIIPEYDEIKNLEIIREADLLVMHIRFRIPPPEQYDLLREYFDSGKPAIAFRTTSHAFWPADKKDWFVPFFGGHYKGHMPSSDGTTTLVPAEQLEHPILRGVPKMNWMNDIMGIYVTAPLNETTRILMMGKTGPEAPAQPVSWTNEYRKGQKIFYTSLGGLESFVDPGFLNMVYNAVFWALDREVPEHGVLGIKDLSAYDEHPPFERFSFGEVDPNPFNRPPEDLKPENSKVLRAQFHAPAIPPPPERKIPRGAEVLFNGKDLSQWRHWDLSAEPVAMLPDARAVSPSPEFPEARWTIKDGALEARPGYGSLLSKEVYGNYRLHLDFLIPEEPSYIPKQYKGSGGIFLDGRYQVKLMDSYGQDATAWSNGSVYGQIAPLVNASKPVNTWQSLEIEYRRQAGGRPIISARLNGRQIHDQVTLLSRSDLAIREDEPLYISSEAEGSGRLNLGKGNWTALMEFRTRTGGFLFSHAPLDRPWNEASQGLILNEGTLQYRQGNSTLSFSDTTALAWDDGKWHRIQVTAEDSTLTAYADGIRIGQVERHRTASQPLGNVFRLGQGSNVFRLGASKLPISYRGEVFDGEIRGVRIYQGVGSPDVDTREKSILKWDPGQGESGNSTRAKGPIRLQADLSKIRYANIWIEPLDPEN